MESLRLIRSLTVERSEQQVRERSEPVVKPQDDFGLIDKELLSRTQFVPQIVSFEGVEVPMGQAVRRMPGRLEDSKNIGINYIFLSHFKDNPEFREKSIGSLKKKPESETVEEQSVRVGYLHMLQSIDSFFKKHKGTMSDDELMMFMSLPENLQTISSFSKVNSGNLANRLGIKVEVMPEKNGEIQVVGEEKEANVNKRLQVDGEGFVVIEPKQTEAGSSLSKLIADQKERQLKEVESLFKEIERVKNYDQVQDLHIKLIDAKRLASEDQKKSIDQHLEKLREKENELKLHSMVALDALLHGIKAYSNYLDNKLNIISLDELKQKRKLMEFNIRQLQSDQKLESGKRQEADKLFRELYQNIHQRISEILAGEALTNWRRLVNSRKIKNAEKISSVLITEIKVEDIVSVFYYYLENQKYGECDQLLKDSRTAFRGDDVRPLEMQRQLDLARKKNWQVLVSPTQAPHEVVQSAFIATALEEKQRLFELENKRVSALLSLEQMKLEENIPTRQKKDLLKNAWKDIELANSSEEITRITDRLRQAFDLAKERYNKLSKGESILPATKQPENPENLSTTGTSNTWLEIASKNRPTASKEGETKQAAAVVTPIKFKGTSGPKETHLPQKRGNKPTAPNPMEQVTETAKAAFKLRSQEHEHYQRWNRYYKDLQVAVKAIDDKIRSNNLGGVEQSINDLRAELRAERGSQTLRKQGIPDSSPRLKAIIGDSELLLDRIESSYKQAVLKQELLEQVEGEARAQVLKEYMTASAHLMTLKLIADKEEETQQLERQLMSEQVEEFKKLSGKFQLDALNEKFAEELSRLKAKARVEAQTDEETAGQRLVRDSARLASKQGQQERLKTSADADRAIQAGLQAERRADATGEKQTSNQEKQNKQNKSYTEKQVEIKKSAEEIRKKKEQAKEEARLIRKAYEEEQHLQEQKKKAELELRWRIEANYRKKNPRPDTRSIEDRLGTTKQPELQGAWKKKLTLNKDPVALPDTPQPVRTVVSEDSKRVGRGLQVTPTKGTGPIPKSKPASVESNFQAEIRKSAEKTDKLRLQENEHYQRWNRYYKDLQVAVKAIDDKIRSNNLGDVEQSIKDLRTVRGKKILPEQAILDSSPRLKVAIGDSGLLLDRIESSYKQAVFKQELLKAKPAYALEVPKPSEQPARAGFLTDQQKADKLSAATQKFVEESQIKEGARIETEEQEFDGLSELFETPNSKIREIRQPRLSGDSSSQPSKPKNLLTSQVVADSRPQPSPYPPPRQDYSSFANLGNKTEEPRESTGGSFTPKPQDAPRKSNNAGLPDLRKPILAKPPEYPIPKIIVAPPIEDDQSSTPDSQGLSGSESSVSSGSQAEKVENSTPVARPRRRLLGTAHVTAESTKQTLEELKPFTVALNSASHSDGSSSKLLTSQPAEPLPAVSSLEQLLRKTLVTDSKESTVIRSETEAEKAQRQKAELEKLRAEVEEFYRKELLQQPPPSSGTVSPAPILQNSNNPNPAALEPSEQKSSEVVPQPVRNPGEVSGNSAAQTQGEGLTLAGPPKRAYFKETNKSPQQVKIAKESSNDSIRAEFFIKELETAIGSNNLAKAQSLLDNAPSLSAEGYDVQIGELKAKLLKAKKEQWQVAVPIQTPQEVGLKAVQQAESEHRLEIYHNQTKALLAMVHNFESEIRIGNEQERSIHVAKMAQFAHTKLEGITRKVVLTEESAERQSMMQQFKQLSIELTAKQLMGTEASKEAESFTVLLSNHVSSFENIFRVKLGKEQQTEWERQLQQSLDEARAKQTAREALGSEVSTEESLRGSYVVFEAEEMKALESENRKFGLDLLKKAGSAIESATTNEELDSASKNIVFAESILGASNEQLATVKKDVEIKRAELERLNQISAQRTKITQYFSDSLDRLDQMSVGDRNRVKILSAWESFGREKIAAYKDTLSLEELDTLWDGTAQQSQTKWSEITGRIAESFAQKVLDDKSKLVDSEEEEGGSLEKAAILEGESVVRTGIATGADTAFTQLLVQAGESMEKAVLKTKGLQREQLIQEQTNDYKKMLDDYAQEHGKLKFEEAQRALKAFEATARSLLGSAEETERAKLAVIFKQASQQLQTGLFIANEQEVRKAIGSDESSLRSKLINDAAGEAQQIAIRGLLSEGLTQLSAENMSLGRDQPTSAPLIEDLETQWNEYFKPDSSKTETSIGSKKAEFLKLIETQRQARNQAIEQSKQALGSLTSEAMMYWSSVPESIRSIYSEQLTALLSTAATELETVYASKNTTEIAEETSAKVETLQGEFRKLKGEAEAAFKAAEQGQVVDLEATGREAAEADGKTQMLSDMVASIKKEIDSANTLADLASVNWQHEQLIAYANQMNVSVNDIELKTALAEKRKLIAATTIQSIFRGFKTRDSLTKRLKTQQNDREQVLKEYVELASDTVAEYVVASEDIGRAAVQQQMFAIQKQYLLELAELAGTSIDTAYSRFVQQTEGKIAALNAANQLSESEAKSRADLFKYLRDTIERAKADQLAANATLNESKFQSLLSMFSKGLNERQYTECETLLKNAETAFPIGSRQHALLLELQEQFSKDVTELKKKQWQVAAPIQTPQEVGLKAVQQAESEHRPDIYRNQTEALLGMVHDFESGIRTGNEQERSIQVAKMAQFAHAKLEGITREVVLTEESAERQSMMQQFKQLSIELTAKQLMGGLESQEAEGITKILGERLFRFEEIFRVKLGEEQQDEWEAQLQQSLDEARAKQTARGLEENKQVFSRENLARTEIAQEELSGFGEILKHTVASVEQAMRRGNLREAEQLYQIAALQHEQILAQSGLFGTEATAYKAVLEGIKQNLQIAQQQELSKVQDPEEVESDTDEDGLSLQNTQSHLSASETPDSLIAGMNPQQKRALVSRIIAAADYEDIKRQFLELCEAKVAKNSVLDEPPENYFSEEKAVLAARLGNALLRTNNKDEAVSGALDKLFIKYLSCTRDQLVQYPPGVMPRRRIVLRKGKLRANSRMLEFSIPKPMLHIYNKKVRTLQEGQPNPLLADFGNRLLKKYQGLQITMPKALAGVPAPTTEGLPNLTGSLTGSSGRTRAQNGKEELERIWASHNWGVDLNTVAQHAMVGNLSQDFLEQFEDQGLTIVRDFLIPYVLCEQRCAKGDKATETKFFKNPASAYDLLGTLSGINASEKVAEGFLRKAEALPQKEKTPEVKQQIEEAKATLSARAQEQTSFLLLVIGVSNKPMNRETDIHGQTEPGGLGGNPISVEQCRILKKMREGGVEHAEAGAGKSKSVSIYPQIFNVDKKILHVSPFPSKSESVLVETSTVDELRQRMASNLQGLNKYLIVLDEYDSPLYSGIQEQLLDAGIKYFEMSATRNSSDIEQVKNRNEEKLRLLNEILSREAQQDLNLQVYRYRNDGVWREVIDSIDPILALISQAVKKTKSAQETVVELPSQADDGNLEKLIHFEREIDGSTAIKGNVLIRYADPNGQVHFRLRKNAQWIELTESDLEKQIGDARPTVFRLHTKKGKYSAKIIEYQGKLEELAVRKQAQLNRIQDDKFKSGGQKDAFEKAIKLGEQHSGKSILVEFPHEGDANTLFEAFSSSLTNKLNVAILYRNNFGDLCHLMYNEESSRWEEQPGFDSKDPKPTTYCLYTKDCRGGDFRMHSNERVAAQVLCWSHLPSEDEIYQQLRRNRQEDFSAAEVWCYAAHSIYKPISSFFVDSKTLQKQLDSAGVRIRAKKKLFTKIRRRFEELLDKELPEEFNLNLSELIRNPETIGSRFEEAKELLLDLQVREIVPTLALLGEIVRDPRKGQITLQAPGIAKGSAPLKTWIRIKTTEAGDKLLSEAQLERRRKQHRSSRDVSIHDIEIQLTDSEWSQLSKTGALYEEKQQKVQAQLSEIKKMINLASQQLATERSKLQALKAELEEMKSEAEQHRVNDDIKARAYLRSLENSALDLNTKIKTLEDFYSQEKIEQRRKAKVDRLVSYYKSNPPGVETGIEAFRKAALGALETNGWEQIQSDQQTQANQQIAAYYSELDIVRGNIELEQTKFAARKAEPVPEETQVRLQALPEEIRSQDSVVKSVVMSFDVLNKQKRDIETELATIDAGIKRAHPDEDSIVRKLGLLFGHSQLETVKNNHFNLLLTSFIPQKYEAIRAINDMAERNKEIRFTWNEGIRFYYSRLGVESLPESLVPAPASSRKSHPTPRGSKTSRGAKTVTPKIGT